MRLSAFNLYVEEFPAPGQVLIHNTFSGAYVVMARDVLETLRRVDRDQGQREREGEGEGELEREIEIEPMDIAAWSDPDVGIVVDSLAREEREYHDWFEAQRARPALQSIVAINLVCNFECPYCCQAEIMDGSVMKPEILARTADWLADRALAINADSAHITFVGGEPLLHPDRIKTMAARLRARLDSHGVVLTLGLITNGYYLDDEMVRELVPHGLTVAQVTLDGDESTHHLSRVSKKGEDTFQRIFDNVIAASRHIRISINGNYQEHTIAGFGALVDRLAEAELPRSNPISFSPALQILSAPSGCAAGARNWSNAPYAYQVALHDRILGHGYATARLNAIGPCGFHDRNMYVIDPRGNVFKCPGFLGHPEWRVGHVSSGLTERYEEMLRLDSRATCGGCAHQPNCGGGCVAGEALRTGAMNVNCEIGYLDAVTPHALVRDYLLATSDDRARALSEFPAPMEASPRPGQQTASGVRSRALRVL
jgi:uncharacterized protein